MNSVERLCGHAMVLFFKMFLENKNSEIGDPTERQSACYQLSISVIPFTDVIILLILYAIMNGHIHTVVPSFP
jgi:hypothetical protein